MGLFRRFTRKPAAERDAEQLPPPTGQRAGRLRTALNRTRAFLATAFATDPEGLVDEEYYEEVLDALVLADMGVELAAQLTAAIKDRLLAHGWVRKSDVPMAAREVLAGVLSGVPGPEPLDPARLSVILLVGVNGSGKTTLAAKLAHRLKGEGQQVLLAAADTFRAAAVDQLKIWAERAGVEIVGGQEGADPASVVFDAAQAAQARGATVLLVDTAGRLQTKKNLMAELDKIDRTIEKACPGANRANLLVLDATVGQNALSQAQLFNEACRLSGVALTKLDGSAKGGAVFTVVEALKVPVLYVGVGEGIEDLLDFEPAEFAAALFPAEG